MRVLAFVYREDGMVVPFCAPGHPDDDRLFGMYDAELRKRVKAKRNLRGQLRYATEEEKEKWGISIPV